MRIPLSYILKSVWARKLTTILTATGMALVVFVFATVLMLSEGLKKTLVDTGSQDNLMVIRQGAETEVQSDLDRQQASIVASLPGIGYRDGIPLVSKEAVVLMTIPKRSTGKPSNVTLRGVSQTGLVMRPQVQLIRGRMFRPGTSEIVAGRKIAEQFNGADIGGTLRFGMREWTITGVFDAGNTGFSSEVWGDADQFMQAFRRTSYSSMLIALADPANYSRMKKRIEDDQRLRLEAKRETVFYAEQSEMMANFLAILGTTLSTIFSIGAIIGAMITMYAAVANRTREIGTLRALGFGKLGILMAFLVESLTLGLFGGVAGLLPASAMQFLTISTMNWQTFAELAFSFVMTPEIVVQSLVFALAMGFVGGVLPAARAARMNIIDALRAA